MFSKKSIAHIKIICTFVLDFKIAYFYAILVSKCKQFQAHKTTRYFAGLYLVCGSLTTSRRDIIPFFLFIN